jgi:NADH dehydrogenase
VRAIVRAPRAARWLAEKYGVELFHGNVLYGPALAGAFDGCQCVIHLVGVINEWQENTFERAHTQATINVVATAKQARVKRYLHMSALGTRANAVSRYHQTKWAAEESVRKSGLAWTIFRPSLIYGPGDKSINVLAKLVRRAPVVPVLGDGRARIQPVAIATVAQAFVAAIKRDDTVGQTYDLCGPAAFNWNELYDKLLAAQGLQKPKLHVPLPLARLPAALLEKLVEYPPFNREQLIMAREDNAGDPVPAERDLGLTQAPFADGISRYLSR